VCDKCHALVHSEELERLAAEAKALEASGDLRRAREHWLMGLQLLPPASKQADWIKQHASALGESAPVLSQQRPTVAAAASRARPGSFLKLTFLLSFAVFVGIYWSASGARFGIGFAVLILIHEMGHYVDIRRRGLPADMPIFLPGLGAYVRWRALGVSLETRAAISLAGPFAGFLAAMVCAVLWWQTGNPLWASLARVGAALNLLNLIPVWILDGGQAALALAKGERIALLAASVALWLLVRENMLLLVALGALYRAFFSRDQPAHPSRVMTVYFIAVLTALAMILWLMPGQGFGTS
jgi:Zn-dependent protease